MQTVLITGNEGYLGPVVIRYLRENHPGVKIIGVDTGFFRESLVSSLEGEFRACLPDVQLTKDVRDLVEADLRGVDAVIHLAAISNDPMGQAFEDVTFEINEKATVKVAEIAKRAGVSRFVFASSCSVYGKAGDGRCDESSPLFPLTAYAKSKANAERSLAEVAENGFQVVAFRFATACGASPRIRLDLVLNDFVATALTAKKIDILSDGTPWRPLIDVRDMARSFAWAIFGYRGDASYLVLNAGRSDWNFQILQLAHVVSEACGGIPVSVNPNAAADSRSYSVNFEAFEKYGVLSGSQLTIHDSVGAVKKILGSYSGLGADFRGSDLIRLKVLERLKGSGKLNLELRPVG
jgi:nucleoside-diphosphate-sugar epimerase